MKFKAKIKNKKNKTVDDKDIWIIEGYWNYYDTSISIDKEKYLIKLPFLRIPLSYDYWSALREAQYIFADNPYFIMYRLYKGKMSEIN